MEKFEVNILGCGSALPTTRHYPASQIINVRDKLFMIDCGEGAQLQLRRSKLKFSRLNHIFISHLHGDHCFGLTGLISTFGMLGRTAQLHLYAHSDLESLLRPQLDYFCKNLSYEVVFHSIDPGQMALVYEDRSITVHSIPLRHRIPCCGFLFAEKRKPNNIIREMIDFYKIPLAELSKVKDGADFITSEGVRIPNERLTKPASASRKYAYCSDTIYDEKIVKWIENVDLLFHEATFASGELARAKDTFHTTARGAALIALKARAKKLIIGHFSARYENEDLLLNEAQDVFPETMLAKENLCVNI